MRIRIGSGLIPLNILVVILVLVSIFFPDSVLRIILGIPFLLFFPGYTLVLALFAKRERMSTIERVTFSFVLSMALVPLIGLILNYTPWGIRLDPVLYSVASFTLITSLVAWLRWRRLTERERFAIQFHVTMPGLGTGWQRVLNVTLVIAILGAIGIVSYTLAAPKVQETFSEFYILGQKGKSATYTSELKVGEEGRVTVGIVNHEGKEVSYRVEVVIGGKKGAELGPVVLANDQKWEGEVGFVPETPAEDQKVEFLLYKNGEAEPCLEPLYLWLDLSE